MNGIRAKRLTCAGALGAVLSVLLVLLVAEPWHVVMCADAQAASGEACRGQRAGEWPGPLMLVAAAAVGAGAALVVALPFARR